MGRPSDCLVEESVRTLKNYLKTTDRNLNGVLKYTVDDFRRSSDDSLAKSCPVAVQLHYIWLRKVSCENCTSISGVAV